MQHGYQERTRNGQLQCAEFCMGCGAQLLRWHRAGKTPSGICPIESRLACRCGRSTEHTAWSGELTPNAIYHHPAVSNG